MIRLQLAGEFQCHAEDAAPIDLPLAKEQGLLAILALSPDCSCSRGKITNLLWSTRSDEQARASLRQSLWSLKKTLGQNADNVLEVNRRRIALNPSVVSIDVGEMRNLAKSSTVEALERVVELHAGELLDGLVIQDPAWEEWLTVEREGVRAMVVSVLRKLIDRYAADLDFPMLIETGRRLVDLDPFQEEGHRALIRGYAETNQRALALKQYEKCREVLRRELAADPDGATQVLVSEVREGTSPTPTPSAALTTTLEQLPRTAPQTGTPSILVYPFSDLSGDASQDYLARGITDDIIVSLTAFRELFVFAYKTSMAIDVDSDDALSVAKHLGARYIVEGGVQKSESQIRVSARLVSAGDGRQLWASRFDRDLKDLFVVQDEVVNMVTNSLVENVEEAHHRQTAAEASENLGAYDFILRGRLLLNRYTRESEMEARRNFQSAINLDPMSAAAHAGLAVSHISVVFEWARKALELDSLNIMALYALAGAHYYNGEYEIANLEIEKAIAINPHDYHNLCSKAWFLTFSGHSQEGLACSIDAMRLNPYSADGCLETIGIGRYLSGDYEQALEAYGSTKGNSLFKLGGLAASYAQLGRVREATRAAKEFMTAADQAESFGDIPANRFWRSYWDRMYQFKKPADRTHYFDGLRKAGIPVDSHVHPS
jgi:DNA-binding SARP family transcriptional activator